MGKKFAGAVIVMDQVFNELSADGKYPTHQDANDAVRKLLDLSKNMTAIGFSRELRVSSNFCSLELCKGLTLGRWLNEHIKEDSGRLLLSYASKMPYVDDVLRDEGKHFTYRGNDAYGLGYAYLRGTVALALECFPEGDTELDSDIGKVSVMTISTCRKFTDGKKHLRQKIFSEIKDGSGLIEKFAVLFPYIRLSKDARKNIASLNGNEDFFRKYINHFAALNEAAITGSIEVL